ncbi:hypothetical protein Goklo_004426 [Gossypium klotzschianum]|uniref:Uncharacterized protein n=1 Tax=Gossypium klotzschianum TaxID=34286 RepID=A0A7J8VNN4_9ROSI|nr:hypothetical protein [Gossypium klotzschianum]
MRIQVRIDVRLLLKRHGEGFCPIRVSLGTQKLEFGWDNSIRAAPRKGSTIVNRWLREGNPKWNFTVGLEGGTNKVREGGNHHGRYNAWQAFNGRDSWVEGRMDLGSNIEDNLMKVVDDGSRGGLSVGWTDEYIVQLRSFSKSHIDVEIEEGEGLLRWKFIGFYGSPDKRVREFMEPFETIENGLFLAMVSNG